jgi:palmitoyltransferase ZDHHC3/7/25
MSMDLDGSRVLTPSGHVHRFLFSAVAILACIAHFKAMTTDPGAVPPDATPLEVIEESTMNDEGSDILISTMQKGKRLCRRCRSFKPQRAHHCR